MLELLLCCDTLDEDTDHYKIAILNVTWLIWLTLLQKVEQERQDLQVTG
jgi:hypothetical protein